MTVLTIKIITLARSFKDILKNSDEIIIVVTGGFHSSDIKEIFGKKNINTLVVTPNICSSTEYAKTKYNQIIAEQSKVISSQALAYTVASCLSDLKQKKLLVNAAIKCLDTSEPEKLKAVFGEDFDMALIDDSDKTAEEQEQISQIAQCFDTAVLSLPDVIFSEGLKEIFYPDIDNIMLSLATELYSTGLYFSKGAILEIETSQYHGKDLNGIPAEIYSRMLSSLQLALLQKQKTKDLASAGENTVIIPENKKEPESGRELTEEEIERLRAALKEETDYYDSIYSYQPQPELQKDIEEIFENLINAMVSLGLITEAEKSQYILHYYYNPTLNAFSVSGSKDIFIFSQFLFELNEIFRKKGEKLTKDIIAAVLAHELIHTIQQSRVYKTDRIVQKGSAKRKEYDADLRGLEILDTAGYNPKAMQKLLSSFCEYDNTPISLRMFLDAHPDSKDRLKEVSSILENKDIVFLNIDKNEQSVTVDEIEKYEPPTAKPRDFVFSEQEKKFLSKATKRQRDFIYELVEVGEPSSVDFTDRYSDLSEKEREELFDFIINTLNTKKVKTLSFFSTTRHFPAIFSKLFAKMTMTLDKLKKLNEFETVHDLFISYDDIFSYADLDKLLFYVSNRKYIRQSYRNRLISKMLQNEKKFLKSESKEKYIRLLFDLMKDEIKNYDRGTGLYDVRILLSEITNASYFTAMEKTEFICLLTVVCEDGTFNRKGSACLNDAIATVLDVIPEENLTDKITGIFDLYCNLGISEEMIADLWNIYLYIIADKHKKELENLTAEQFESIVYKINGISRESLSPFTLGWFIKSFYPDLKIYFTSYYRNMDVSEYSDGICLWHRMFEDKDFIYSSKYSEEHYRYYENRIKNIIADNKIDINHLISKLIEFQKKLLETGVTPDIDLCGFTYMLLKEYGLFEQYKYELKYLLHFLKNAQDAHIDTEFSSEYPVEHLKNITLMSQLPYSVMAVFERQRFTKYFVNLAEMYGFLPDYLNGDFSQFVLNIKKHFSMSYKEEEIVSDINSKITEHEIINSFVCRLHKIFSLEPLHKSIKFNLDNDGYLYTYFEMNSDLLKQNPTTEQAQQMIDLFKVIKKELPAETLDVYAKIIYRILKNNPELSLFFSADENMRLIDFLFDGFSKEKDDCINEMFDRFVITPEQYYVFKNKMTLAWYEQYTEEENRNVAKNEILYFMIQNNTDMQDRIRFLLWLMSSPQDGSFYKPKMMNKIEVKANDDITVNFDSLKTEFLFMSKSEREKVIRTLLLGSNGILSASKQVEKNKNIEEVVTGLQHILFDSLFFTDKNTSDLNSAMADMFKKIFEIVFNNLNDERKVVFINNMFSAIIDLDNVTGENIADEGEKRAGQLGRLIVAMGVNSGMGAVKLLQILSGNGVFEKLDKKYGTVINAEVSKVRSENEPLSKPVIFQYFEKLGLLDSVEFVGQCLGSASVGLTYLVKFRDRKFADVVKIKRPNVMKNYEEDFSIFENIREYIVSQESPLPEQYKKMIPRAEHLRNLFDEELSFETESLNLQRFGRQLKHRNSAVEVSELVSVPDVDRKQVVLFTQSRAEGVPLSKMNMQSVKKQEIYIRILKEFFTELFSDAADSDTGTALYHADLHAGNIFVNKDNKITFIDLGGIGTVTKQQSISLKKIFIYLCLGNYDGFIKTLKQYNGSIVRQFSGSDKRKIKKILRKKTSLESKFADLFEVFNNQGNMDRDFLMFMQAISKIAAYIDGLSFVDDNKINFDNVFKSLGLLFDKDMSGLKNIAEDKNKAELLKKMAVSVYLKKYDDFIKNLISYDPILFADMDKGAKGQIKYILTENGTLEDKLKKLSDILKNTDANLSLMTDTLKDAVHFVGEDIFKEIVQNMFVSRIKNKILKLIPFKESEEKNAESEYTEHDSFTEIILDKCADDVSKMRNELETAIRSIESSFVRKYLETSIIRFNALQLKSFIEISNKLYSSGYINSSNEKDTIKLLFDSIFLKRSNLFFKQLNKFAGLHPHFISEIFNMTEELGANEKEKLNILSIAVHEAGEIEKDPENYFVKRRLKFKIITSVGIHFYSDWNDNDRNRAETYLRQLEIPVLYKILNLFKYIDHPSRRRDVLWSMQTVEENLDDYIEKIKADIEKKQQVSIDLAEGIDEVSITSILKENNNMFFYYLDRYAHIWEEIVFRAIPAFVALINPVIGISMFAAMQPLFIFSHTIVKWLVQKDSAGNRKSFKELVKNDFKGLSLPTAGIIVPYIIGIITSVVFPGISIPAITASAAVASKIHKTYNDKFPGKRLTIASLAGEDVSSKIFFSDLSEAIKSRLIKEIYEEDNRSYSEKINDLLEDWKLSLNYIALSEEAKNMIFEAVSSSINADKPNSELAFFDMNCISKVISNNKKFFEQNSWTEAEQKSFVKWYMKQIRKREGGIKRIEIIKGKEHKDFQISLEVIYDYSAKMFEDFFNNINFELSLKIDDPDEKDRAQAITVKDFFEYLSSQGRTYKSIKDYLISVTESGSNSIADDVYSFYTHLKLTVGKGKVLNVSMMFDDLFVWLNGIKNNAELPCHLKIIALSMVQKKFISSGYEHKLQYAVHFDKDVFNAVIKESGLTLLFINHNNFFEKYENNMRLKVIDEIKNGELKEKGYEADESRISDGILWVKVPQIVPTDSFEEMKQKISTVNILSPESWCIKLKADAIVSEHLSDGAVCFYMEQETDAFKQKVHYESKVGISTKDGTLTDISDVANIVIELPIKYMAQIIKKFGINFGISKNFPHIKRIKLICYRGFERIKLLLSESGNYDSDAFYKKAEELFDTFIKEIKEMIGTEGVNKAMVKSLSAYIEILQKYQNGLSENKNNLSRYLETFLEQNKYEEVQQRFSIFEPLKYRNNFFFNIDKYSHIWEEVIFRVIPMVFAVLNPVLIPVFISIQIMFILAHAIVKSVTDKEKPWSQKRASDILSESFKYLSFPTAKFVLPYFIGIVFAPYLSVFNAGAVLLSFFVSSWMHYKYNKKTEEQHVFDTAHKIPLEEAFDIVQKELENSQYSAGFMEYILDRQNIINILSKFDEFTKAEPSVRDEIVSIMTVKLLLFLKIKQRAKYDPTEPELIYSSDSGIIFPDDILQMVNSLPTKEQHSKEPWIMSHRDFIIERIDARAELYAQNFIYKISVENFERFADDKTKSIRSRIANIDVSIAKTAEKLIEIYIDNEEIIKIEREEELAKKLHKNITVERLAIFTELLKDIDAIEAALKDIKQVSGGLSGEDLKNFNKVMVNYYILLENLIDKFGELYLNKFMAEHAKGVTRLVCDVIETGKTELGNFALPKNKIVLYGILHDIGKNMVSNKLLDKKERLDNEEYEMIKQHVTYGSEILKDSHIKSFYEDFYPVAKYHHLRWLITEKGSVEMKEKSYPVMDIKGYLKFIRNLTVSGMASHDVVNFLKIIAIVDSYDAMTRERAYNKNRLKTPKEAIEDFKETDGIDMRVVNILKELVVNKSDADEDYAAVYEQKQEVNKTDKKRNDNKAEQKNAVKTIKETVYKFLGTSYRNLLIVYEFIKNIFSNKTTNISAVADYIPVNYKELQNAVQKYGNNEHFTAGEDNVVNHIPVLVVDKLSQLPNNTEFKNTGIKADGQSIYWMKTNGIIVIGTLYDRQSLDIVKSLNGSSFINNCIKDMLSELYGIKIGKLSVQSLIISSEVDEVEVEDTILLIPEKKFEDESIKLGKYIRGALEVKKAISVMYSQKMIISLEKIEDFDVFVKMLKNGKARKVISVRQYEYLKSAESSLLQFMSELRQNGIEVYIRDAGEIRQDYKSSGITGQLLEKDIYDYYSNESVEIKIIKNVISLDELADRIVNSDKPILIDIKTLQDIFKTERDITKIYSGLNAVMGNMKLKIGLGTLSSKDIYSMVFNMDMEDLPLLKDLNLITPNMSDDEFFELMATYNADSIRIIKESKAITEGNRHIFAEALKERVLTKKVLTEKGKEFGLKDKKLEILLGKMLVMQLSNNDKTTTEIEDKIRTDEEFIKDITKLAQKAYEGDEIAVNSVVEMIPVFADGYKLRPIKRVFEEDRTTGYRAMLAAA